MITYCNPACQPLSEPVYVDREMWEKIVLNLLSNAFKFTFSGEIVVLLRQVENWAELTVRDTGIGIPAVELPRLFERFHRVEGAQGRTQEGSGIGLALVQELVRLHGGQIQVESTEGAGTTFTITIPTGIAHLPSEQIQPTQTLTASTLGAVPYVEEALRWLPEVGQLHETAGKSEQAPPDSSIPSSIHPSTLSPATTHILLIDDNADMRSYVARLLLSQGYGVETATDGIAALALIQQQLPDLVLTDVMMPRLDGFGLLRQLRTAPTTREIPVILLSARAGEEARIEGLAAGADDYLTKPFSARELLARVEATLKLAQLRRAAAQQEQILRLEAETVKQEAEAAYQHINQILECMTDAFVAFDRQWCYTYANPAALQLLQKPLSALIGKNVWQEVFPSEAGGFAYQQLHRVLTEQVAVSWEEFGEPIQRWLEVRAYPSGEGIAVYFQDITQRKQAEEELRQKNAILNVINESTPTPIFVKDRQGRIIYANPATLAVFGKSAEAVIGFRDCDFYPNPEDAARVMENDQRVMASGEMEVVEESPDGIRTFLGMKVPYRNELGAVIGLIGISNDISERVQIERDREQVLQQEQAARQAAESANRIKDEFLAVLSHELRSPLNPILGWSRLLQNGSLDAARTKQALTTIERNAKLQAELIEDLLDVSRILQGKLSLTVSPIHLASIIQAAIETVRLAAEAKSIQIETKLHSEIGLVAGDPTRLQQIVWNLLSNAVKFTRVGGRVTVQLQPIDNQAQITVSDTGKGIAPDFLPHVFEYFRQADSATTRKFGGLGLGLAIVRHLVELHGGTIQADSPGEGLGATFSVRLPLMPTPPKLNQNPQSSEPCLDLHGIRVLVVDDEVDTREFIEFLLEQAGAAVVSVASAGDAITAVAQFQPDIVLSDIGMPEMDGYMLLRQIRALSPDQGGKIPAIALTAYAGELDQKQAIAAGFQHHIAKPVEPDRLVKLIADLTQSQSCD